MIQALALRNFGANRLKLVVNRMPKRTEIQLPELEKVMGHPIFCGIPNAYQAVTEAYGESKLLEPDSKPGIEIGRMAIKLAGLASVENKGIRGLFGFGKK
jgi:Flp pilus assembly CpaE family ATPase